MSAQFPAWMRRPLTVHGRYRGAKALVEELRLHTVCQEAHCPNLGECWSRGNVSFMILGDRCTRRCAFCAVTTGRPAAVDGEEPERLAEAVARLGLRVVVITSVARDDLADEGAGLFAACIRSLKERVPGVRVEALVPDFHARGELIERVIEARPDVYSHNLETVERLSPEIRPQAGYRRSLQVLKIAKEKGRPGMETKSGLMVGFGERPAEVRQTLVDLRGAGCDIVTLGQYLQPAPAHRPVVEFVPPRQFERYRSWAQELGFSFVASAPTVRSSTNAFEALRG